MKKKLLLVVFILFFAAFNYSTINAEGVSVTIDSNKVTFDRFSGFPFIDSSSRVQVPFRATMEKFGCSVTWNQMSRMATAKKDGIVVNVPIGQQYIYKDGVKIPNDTSAVVEDNRTYLPIRAVLEAFDAVVGWDIKNQTVVANTVESPEMKLYFIDVDQGDAIFVDFGDYEILVDAGGPGNEVAKYIKPFVDGDLEVLIATHIHIDHIGGIPSVLRAFQVNNVIDSGEIGGTPSYYKFLEQVLKEPDCNFVSDSDLSFNMGNGAKFKVIEAGDGNNNTNNNSVITLVDYNDVEVLLMSDLNTSIEDKNILKFSEVEILKAGHHGSKGSSGYKLLSKTNPSSIIISAGLNNLYRHPHQEALNRMFAFGAQIYGTYKSGTIIATTDGYSYTLNTKNEIVPPKTKTAFLAFTAFSLVQMPR